MPVNAGAEAVIVQRPTPVVVPVAVPFVVPTVHGPVALKLTGCPSGLLFDSAIALTENWFPYCTFGNCDGDQTIVCPCVVELAGKIVNDSETGVAAS
jgi:hypothetical protein